MELINKFTSYNPQEQQRILDKYKDAVYTVYNKTIDQNELFRLLYCLEFSYNYIENNFKDQTKVVRAWCMVALLRAIKNKTINTEDDITSIIIRTVEHFKSEYYGIYINNIDLYNSEYSRDVEYLNNLIV